MLDLTLVLSYQATGNSYMLSIATINTEELFNQFEVLYKTNNLPDCHNSFIEDGINNTDLFEQQKIKILFIAKEHNYTGQQNDEAYKEAAYRVWSKQGVYLQFAHRLSEWAYGLLNGFPPYEQLTYEDKHKALQSIAFINVKKASGNSSANPKHICQYIIKSQFLLHQQIEDIVPTLIVCCFRYDHYVELLFGNKMVRTGSSAYSIGTWKGIDVINFYHPSARKNKKLLYEQLEEAYTQLVFNSVKSSA